jgi:hypothetical protein
MSFDAENRNNINTIIITNNNINNYSSLYINNVLRNINRMNRCSFCNCIGHNIRTCADQRINDFEQECRLSKTFCEWTEDPRNTFKEWLMEYYLIVNSEVVKAFSVSRCNCRMYSNIDVIIDSVTSYIYQDQEEVLDNDSLQEVYNLLLSLQNPNRQVNEINSEKFNITTNVEKLEEQQCEEICECAICYEESIPKKHNVTLNCKHQFCKDCFKGCLKSTTKDFPSCALCRADISEIKVHDESVKSEFDEFIN